MADLHYQVLEMFADEFIHVQHAYIDISGSLTSGTLLSQIAYWFKPNKDGSMKVHVFKDGHYWLAKGRTDWMDEIRLTEYEYDHAIKVLKAKGFVETRLFKFNGVPTTHIRLIEENLNSALREWVDARKEKMDAIGKRRDAPIEDSGSGFSEDSKRDLDKIKNGIYGKSEMKIGDFQNSLTENTTEITTEHLNTPQPPHEGAASDGRLQKEDSGKEARRQTASIDQLEHDFEIIYALYPKKSGRTNAFMNYRQWVSAKGKDVAGRKHRLSNRQIYLAVKNYVRIMTDSGKDMQYWKNFDTLMGRQLLDYLTE